MFGTVDIGDGIVGAFTTPILILEHPQADRLNRELLGRILEFRRTSDGVAQPQ